MTTRNLTLSSILTLALALFAVLLLVAPSRADVVAGSGGLVVPDVGAAPTNRPALAGSGGLIVPDIGAAPFASPVLAGSGGLVVPDVG